VHRARRRARARERRAAGDREHEPRRCFLFVSEGGAAIRERGGGGARARSSATARGGKRATFAGASVRIVRRRRELSARAMEWSLRASRAKPASDARGRSRRASRGFGCGSIDTRQVRRVVIG
jgi:hypothetical protein